jgi:cell division protein FtsL
MSDPTREEIDAKLAAAEARTETRFTELSGKMDRMADSIAVLGSTIRIELESVKSEIADVKSEIADVKADIANVKADVANVKSDVVDLRSDNKYTRWTIVVTVVASALAAIAALWVTQANLLAAFSAGIAVRTETRESPPSTPPPPALRPDTH